MPKSDPDAIAPVAILQKARKRALRPGEVDALALYISGLERQAASLREAQAAISSRQHVELALSQDSSALVVILPGAPPHSVRLPAGDPALGMKFLVQTLRNRRGDPQPIGTGGAPTQADLEALRKATSVRAKRVGVATSLEDLGL